MLDFTNTPARRKKAARARERRFLCMMGLAIAVPAAAWAFDLQHLARLVGG